MNHIKKLIEGEKLITRESTLYEVLGICGDDLPDHLRVKIKNLAKSAKSHYESKLSEIKNSI